MSAPPFDRAQIEAHVALLHDLASGVSGKLILTAFEEDPLTGRKGPPRVQHFRIGDVDGMVEAVMGYEACPNLNVYAPWAVFRSDLDLGKKGSEADVVASLAAVPDIDGDKFEQTLPFEAPYVIETSPGNSQPVYPWSRPLTTAETKPLLVRLGEAVGGDAATQDASHVWRIAGTSNWPTKSKLARGRSPAPAPVRALKPINGGLGFTVGVDAGLPELAPRPQCNGAHVLASGRDGDIVCAALAYMGNQDLDYDYRCKVGAAIHAAGLPKEIWDEWSSRSSKFEPGFQDRTWSGFKAERWPVKVNIGTIIRWAKLKGFQPPPRDYEAPGEPAEARRPFSDDEGIYVDEPDVGEPPPDDAPSPQPAADRRPVRLEDFVAYMQSQDYVFMPAGNFWPGARVDARVPPVKLFDKAGQPDREQESANSWRCRPAHGWPASRRSSR